MQRFLTLLLALVALGWSGAASAEVTVHFHSFNGSVLWGRYPHTFVVLEGTLEDGTRIDENYGFSALKSNTDALRGPVKQTILIEKPKTIRSTNRHFSVEVSDAKYRQIRDTMVAWRDAPGPYYDLDKRNCIHFVGTIAKIVGLKVTYPSNMLRRPKKWLNHITSLNPQLNAKEI
ncbi:hypothetical protein [Qipengyuania sp. JC766]|uniref:hypothetical protein n=1 Tax=Qipengyuania sp. JC766 TaxID=3232139 RepID=UPI003457C261